ncbi:MAG TPA: bifunctional phosphopantothenoylcysteine decarboxylase/phosphopantothenate--cysteine ligase CoaBC, partial [Pseudorhodoplanes sp.]|nr:bifunctional phosphopantothenoylcysteine decarboxylase/phosphopantothenate--cysteine ligase CoaBC [Pseudorhodoplanes sp.]
ATTVLLATDKPILLAPAMNPRMWDNKATQRNAAQLGADGLRFVGPNEGEMAESGEGGIGRMAEPLEIVAAIEGLFAKQPVAARPLTGKHVLITSGPTYEPIDPVRYIANRSSGKQGHAIAAAALSAGADVTLISGPVHVPDPAGARMIKVETAREMLQAVEKSLPADVAIFAAAVADWSVAKPAEQKTKKDKSGAPQFALTENPDILATIARRNAERPGLVIGFAAETENVIEHAKEKLRRKGCDWIIANDVSPQTGIMGGDRNTVHLVTGNGVESWPPQSKIQVAQALVARIATVFAGAAR